MLSLGNYGVGFDWGIPDEAVEWLARDFAPTGESLAVDLETVRYLLDTTFAGGTEFGLWLSIDGGKQWSRWTHGIPTCSAMASGCRASTPSGTRW